jgi:hypothetical protein
VNLTGDGAVHRVAFRELGAEDAPHVAMLRDRILAHLPHPDDYVPHAEEDAFLAAHFGVAGVCLGIELDRRLVGLSMLTFDLARAHLDVELCDAIVARGMPVAQTCVLAVTMLDPGARGLGLHRGAIERRLAIARDRGRAHAVAIASPSNTSSLCNLLRQGGRVEGILDLPDGRVRYLIAFGEGPSPSPTTDFGLVPVADPEGLRPLLRRRHVGHEIVFVAGRAHFRVAPAADGPPDDVRQG